MTNLSIRCIVVTLLLAMAGGAAHATQPVTYVSSTGVDTNDGSRLAPCATLSAAIAKTDTGGEIDVLDSGVYVNHGSPLIIDKNITIDGGAGRMGHIRATITLGLRAAAVTLRNLAFDCSGSGINDEAPSSNVIVDNCAFICQQYAITTDNDHSNLTVSHSTITGGQRGVWIEPEDAFEPVQISLQNDTITGTSGAAVFVETLGADINNCLIANCFEGVTVDDNGFATVENCNLTHDNTGVIVNQSSALSISDDNFQFDGLALDPIGNGNLISAGNNKFNFNTNIGTAPGYTTTVE